ncbi:MAG: histidine phosphatase family protein [bacterium]|nr:histidine phosphatase family protein [bacterium]
MKVYIVRHGETEKNKEKVLQGRSNSPLNDAGRAQSRKVRDWFAEQGILFDKVYSSPLSRAMETARIIAGDSADLISDDRLLEMDYGPYEGSSLTDPLPEIVEFFSDFVNNPAPEGMESLSEIVARLGNFMMEIANDGEECVLVATHAIAMKGAIEYLTPDSKGKYWSTYFPNCVVYETEFAGGGYSVPARIEI